MKRLILAALVATVLIGGAALAQSLSIIYLKCNGHSQDRSWIVVDGPFGRMADCERAAQRHGETHYSRYRTQCSLRR